MYSTRSGASGTVALRIDAPTLSTVRIEVRDRAGRCVARRRVHDRVVTLDLPVGTHRVTATAAGLWSDGVEVTVGAETGAATLTLTRGCDLGTTTTRWARVTAVHATGERAEARADGRGRATLTGLRPGAWTVVAHDARRGLCSEHVTVDLGEQGTTDLDLPARTPTGRLLVHVGGGDRRPVLVDEVVVTDAAGRRVTAPVREGLADVRDLCPGPATVTVPASVGHLGTTVATSVDPGTWSALTAVSPVGASVSGRVVQGGQQYAAVVALLDEEGAELERVRTDQDGRFVLGTGLHATNGLTVVATSGPETLHVTRAAVADVCVLAGVRHHLGDVALPVAGPRALWAARTPAVAGMRLPSTHV